MSGLFGAGPKPQAAQDQRANGLQVQSSAYGKVLTIVYGRARLPGNLMWYGDFRAIPHKQEAAGSGKGGGGGGNATTTYTYSASFALALCEGEIAGLGRIWRDSGSSDAAQLSATVFKGTAGQAPWSKWSGDAALHYPYVAYVGFGDADLGSSASLPNLNFEVFGLLPFSADIQDCEPSAVIIDALTSPTHGLGFDYLGDLSLYRSYCVANGLFLSPTLDTERSMADQIGDLLTLTNSAPVWSAGQLKIIPYGDENVAGNGAQYVPPIDVQYDLTDDDFQDADEPVHIERKPLADRSNAVRIEMLDAAKNYVQTVVEAKDQADIDARGVRNLKTITAHAIKDPTIGRGIAQRILQRQLYIRTEYTFSLPLNYSRLEPMDVVTLTSPSVDLDHEPVRITQIDESDDGMTLDVMAEEFAAGVFEGALYATEPHAGAIIDTNVAPDATQVPIFIRAPQFLVDTPEIWIGAAGAGPNWGGAHVWISYDESTYEYLTTVYPGARYGTLAADLPVGADPDTANTLTVGLYAGELAGATQAAADKFATMALVDHELIAYANAALNAGGEYDLTYLRRGGYGTAIAAHAAGAPFLRVDENLVRVPFDPGQVGDTIYIKFTAFNLYGAAEEDIADAEVYSYVIGQGEEVPDVPPVPTEFNALPIADGVHLTWENPNPAAVLNTYIEYSTDDLNWGTLRIVGGATEYFDHHFDDGAHYFYRLWCESPSHQASDYTGVLDSTGKTVIDGANVGATIGTDLKDPDGNVAGADDVLNSHGGATVLNPRFEGTYPYVSTYGWNFDASPGAVADGEFYAERGDSSPYAPIPTYLVHQGQAGETTAHAANQRHNPVQAGQVVAAQIAIRAVGTVNAEAYARATINWLDSAGNGLGQDASDITIGPAGTYANVANSKLTKAAPTNAAGYYVGIQYVNHTAGYITATAAVSSIQPDNLSSVPDDPAGDRFAVKATEKTGGGRGFVAIDDGNVVVPGSVDFSRGYLNKTLDNIGEGATYGRALKARLNSGKPWIDFSETFHLNKTIDYMGDGANFRRVGAGYTDANNRVTGFYDSSAAIKYDGPTAGDGIRRARTGLGIDGTLTDQLNSLTRLKDRTLDNVADTSIYRREVAQSFHSETVDNASFELPIGSDGLPPGWESFGSGGTITFSLGSGGAPAGTSYIHVTGGAGAANFGLQSLRKYSVTPGDFIKLSASVFSESGAYGNVQIRFYQADGTVASSTPTAGGSVFNTWQTITAQGPAPSDAAYFCILLFNPNTNGGSTYFDNVRVSTNDVRVAGSGARIADSRNAPTALALAIGGGPADVNAVIASAGGDFSIAAFTVRGGGSGNVGDVHYNAVSNVATGVPAGSVRWFATADPFGTGGTRTWTAYTRAFDAAAQDVVAGYGTARDSGSSGGGSTGGTYCVTPDMWIDDVRQAGDLWYGSRVRCADGQWRRVRPGWRGIPAILQQLWRGDWRAAFKPLRRVVPCVTVYGDAGYELDCSTSTPFTLPGPDPQAPPHYGGQNVEPGVLFGKPLYCDGGWQTCRDVESIGMQAVVQIYLGGHIFAAGRDAARRIYSHNMKMGP